MSPTHTARLVLDDDRRVSPVSIALAEHHLELRGIGKDPYERKIGYPLLLSCTLASIAHEIPLIVRTRTFEVLTLLFEHGDAATDLYESLKALVVPTSIDRLLAYSTPPSADEPIDGWSVYSPARELARMGVGGEQARTTAWRWSDVNRDYEVRDMRYRSEPQFCSTYPASLAVPARISDVTLRYGRTYRSKSRIPVLVYLHRHNLGSITRASQPMVGLKNARSIQDEKLVEAIFQSHTQHSGPLPSTSAVVYGAKATNVIIDARPTTNAMANVAKGAGTENMERYRNSTKVYLGIDNIHVMRDSLRVLNEALREAEVTGSVDRRALRRSGWVRHIAALLDGAVLIARNVHIANSHVLVHCSDGWDRTSQLSALAQICLDPYYRTLDGFAVLIEKEFSSFGHKFGDRIGHLCPDRTEFIVAPSDDVSPQAALLATVQRGLHFQSHAFKETCPVFHQFLDCTFQLLEQFPARFEFDQSFLMAIHRASHSCEHGTFLFNSEREREAADARKRTRSVWSDLLAPRIRQAYVNAAFDPSLDDAQRRASDADMGVILPDPKAVQWWSALFRRELAPTAEEEPVPSPETIVASAGADPVIAILEPAQAPTPQVQLQDAVAQSFGRLWTSARKLAQA